MAHSGKIYVRTYLAWNCCGNSQQKRDKNSKVISFKALWYSLFADTPAIYNLMCFLVVSYKEEWGVVVYSHVIVGMA